jgi:N-acetylmuramic acid 6-phosphate etherase
MVALAAGVGAEAARAALDAAGGEVKVAALVARGLDPAAARAALDTAGGSLRRALDREGAR